MKALNLTQHQTNLTNILLEIYKNSALGPFLGFKGGTAARLFYRLPRFSVDLDFDLITPMPARSEALNRLIKTMTQLLAAKYQIKDQNRKYATLFWLVSYGAGLTKIKLEISTRINPGNHYYSVHFYGSTVKILALKDMIAHKLVTITNRKTIANRDLFDAHYFLGLPEAAQINYAVIKQRTGKNPEKFYRDLLKFLNGIKPKNILAGLGEVLTQAQKDWVKAKLITELTGLVQRQLDIIKA